MLIPALLLNLAVVTLFFTAVSFGGLMIWREKKHAPNTTTVRPPTTHTPNPTRPTMSIPTRPGPITMSPVTPTRPTMSPLTPSRPTMSPLTPTRPTSSPQPTTEFPMPTTGIPVSKTICETDACKEAEKQLNRRIRRDLDPCNDLYQFACGKMKLKEGEETENDEVLTETIIVEKYNDILVKPETPEDIEPVKLAKQMYTQCYGTPKPVTSQINEIIKMKDDTESMDSTNITSYMPNVYAAARRFGYLPRSLFIIDMVQRLLPDNTPEKIIIIRKPSPSSKFYAWPLDTTSMNLTYLEKWVNIKQNLQYKSFMEDYESEEQEIANAYSDDGTPPDHDFTLATLSQAISFPLADIIRKVFEPTVLPDDQKVKVECLSCLQKLEGTTILRDLQRFVKYIFRHVLADYLLDTNEEGVEQWFIDHEGTTEPSGRYKSLFCTSKIVSLFKKAMDYEYIRKYVDVRKKRSLTTVFNQANISLANLILNSQLDESKQETHLKQLRSLGFYTPLNEALSDKNAIESYYSGLQLNPTSYHDSLETVRKHMMTKTAEEFLKKDTPIPIVAPHYMFGEKFMHYDGDMNSIYLSVAALQNFFLSTDRPEFLNFGALGSVIGYGLSQAVSSEGSLQAQEKKRLNFVIFGAPSEADKKENKTRQCFVKSLKDNSNLKEDEITKPMKNAIVFESDGVQIAYYAYMNFRAELKDFQDQALPSFQNYSDGAMFFTTYANMACSRDALTQEDDYIAAEFKVKVATKTSKDFDSEFGCSNTVFQKCNLWVRKTDNKTELVAFYDLFS